MTLRTPYDRHVAACLAALACGADPAVSATAGAVTAPLRDGAPCCLVFSPHPDDEALVGGLALRLRQRHGWRVVNVAVTLGSRPERRTARWDEAQACCAYLGFELVSPVGVAGRALERITPEAARADPAHWAGAVQAAAALLRRFQPRAVLAPHAQDGHPTHVGTHGLVRDALAACGSAIDAHLFWSEYWATQAEPRLRLELDPAEVAQLVTACALHAGEVARHPYHLLLPALLTDSARRGTELVGALGSASHGAALAALYGWDHWRMGRTAPAPPRMLTAQEDLDALLR
jgi:LmbE family N-acetylglucosaminyl deacetylase